MKKSFLNTIQNTLAKSRIATAIAVKVRNQCDRIIGQRYSIKDFSMHANGEYLILDLLLPNCTKFFDVGANKGDWSAYVLENLKNDSRFLYLYEPGSVAFSLISNRFKGFNNVTLNNLALSDHSEKIEFYEQENAGELSSALQSWVKGNYSTIEVQTSTIDSELSRLQLAQLDYLKIDTEGFDLKVLKGAVNAIANHKIRFIQFEYNYVWSMSGSTLLAAYELLEKHGYKIYLVNPDGLYTYDVRKNGEYQGFSNYIAIAPSNTSYLEKIIKGKA